MRKYPGIPELLEQGADERGVTVQELRDRFGLTRYQCNTVSGFLRRLEFGSFGQFPYIIVRIESAERMTSSGPPKCRYLVKLKAAVAANIPGMIHYTGVGARLKVDIGESG